VSQYPLAAPPEWFHNETIMNITIKDLPADVHRRLKERAEESGRSLNKMIVHLLASETRPRKIDRAELLGSSVQYGSPEEIKAMIEEGRM